MEIKKEQIFTVRHKVKGVFKAVALSDFDTELDEYYPIAVLETVRGFTEVWEKGDPIPCRRGLSRIVFESE